MSYIFAPAPIASLPIVGTEARFPVRRIWCVGQNYAAHAREMGGSERNPPFFFAKPADVLVPEGATIPYPPGTQNLHHEVELVVALHKGGTDIAVERALDLVYAYAVGLDLTRRDLQREAKAQGRPWEMAKAFERSAPCSALVPAARIGHPSNAAIALTVNGEPRQSANIADMTWNVAEILAALSRLVELGAGDLIFTGTPAGVGAVLPGQTMLGSIAGIGTIRCSIEAPT